MSQTEEYRLALAESYEKLAAAFELSFDTTLLDTILEAGTSNH
jgi:hypothetical protein